MVFFSLLTICFTAYWFTANTKGALTCIISFSLGCIVVAINVFICLKYSICANSKMMVEAHAQKGSAVEYAYLVGALISTGGISILILVLATIFYSSHHHWGYDEAT